MTTTTERLSETPTGERAVGLVGPVVGVLAIATMITVGAGFSVTDDLPVATMIEKLDAVSGALLLGGGVQALVALGLVLFGAHVRRSLTRREPVGSMTPDVAWGGALLAAAMIGVAAAHTQLASSLEGAKEPAVQLAAHVFEENLFAGAWCAVALIAGAVAVAGLRRGAVARWFGAVSAFVAVLLVVAQVVVPWAGWFPAAAWMIASGFGLREPRH